MKLVERMPRVSSRQRVATLKNVKYTLICLTLFVSSKLLTGTAYQWIDEGTTTVCSTRPHPSRIWSEMSTDDLVLLSTTKEGLTQHQDILHRFCQTWALTVNLSKTKNNGVPKKVQMPGPQIQIPSRHHCTRAHKKIYTYLGLISATGNFHKGLQCHQKEHQIRHNN